MGASILSLLLTWLWLISGCLHIPLSLFLFLLPLPPSLPPSPSPSLISSAQKQLSQELSSPGAMSPPPEPLRRVWDLPGTRALTLTQRYCLTACPRDPSSRDERVTLAWQVPRERLLRAAQRRPPHFSSLTFLETRPLFSLREAKIKGALR